MRLSMPCLFHESTVIFLLFDFNGHCSNLDYISFHSTYMLEGVYIYYFNFHRSDSSSDTLEASTVTVRLQDLSCNDLKLHI
jgi:hypothetical protein